MSQLKIISMLQEASEIVFLSDDDHKHAASSLDKHSCTDSRTDTRKRRTKGTNLDVVFIIGLGAKETKLQLLDFVPSVSINIINQKGAEHVRGGNLY